MTTPPIASRAALLAGAAEAERLQNWKLASHLKELSLLAQDPTPGAAPADVAALKAQIADAEDAGDWPRAGALKSQLLEAQRARRP